MIIADERQFSRATASVCQPINRDKPSTRTQKSENHSDACPGMMPEAPQPCNPAGLCPDNHLPGDMNLQSQINPLASADAGGTAGHDAAACVSARGKCDDASVCDARDARMLSPTTLPFQAQQVVAPHQRQPGTKFGEIILGARREPGNKFGEIVRLHQRKQARARGAPSQPARRGRRTTARKAHQLATTRSAAPTQGAPSSPRALFAVAAGQANGGGGWFLRSPASGQERDLFAGYLRGAPGAREAGPGLYIALSM